MLHVWPDGTEAASNVLDTYIHHLRDKLEIPGDAPMMPIRQSVVLATRCGCPMASGRGSATATDEWSAMRTQTTGRHRPHAIPIDRGQRWRRSHQRPGSVCAISASRPLVEWPR